MPPSRHREVRASLTCRIGPGHPRGPLAVVASRRCRSSRSMSVGSRAPSARARSEGARASARDARPRCAAGSGGVRAPGSDRHGDRPRAPARRRAAKAAGVARRRRARRRGDVRARDGGRDRALLGGPGGARSATRACGGGGPAAASRSSPMVRCSCSTWIGSSTRRRFAGRGLSDPGAAPGALGSRRRSGRSAPVAPSNGLSPSPPQRDPPLVTIALAPALPASRVPPRLAARGQRRAAPCRQRDRPRLARRAHPSRERWAGRRRRRRVPRLLPRRPEPGATRATGRRRTSSIAGTRSARGTGFTGASSAPPPSSRWPSLRCSCGGARRLGWHRMRAPSRPYPPGIERGVVDSSVPAAPSGSRRSPRGTQHLGLVPGAGRRAAHPAPRVVRGRGPWRFALAPRWRAPRCPVGVASAPRPEPRRDRGSGSDRPRAAPRLAGGGALRTPWLGAQPPTRRAHALRSAGRRGPRSWASSPNAARSAGSRITDRERAARARERGRELDPVAALGREPDEAVAGGVGADHRRPIRHEGARGPPSGVGRGSRGGWSRARAGPPSRPRRSRPGRRCTARRASRRRARRGGRRTRA